jgi:hypothetical protein
MENIKDDGTEEMTLLQTIKIPKNLGFLTDKLPQANYEKFPNKRNLSFTNNNEKGKIKLKKNIKKIEKEKDHADENKDNNEDEQGNKKYHNIDEDEDNTVNKRKKRGSLDHSQISGVNNNNNNNIKVIKNTENIEINKSNIKEKEREKSPIMDREKRTKEINANNILLPNIKNQGSVDEIRGNRNK